MSRGPQESPRQLPESPDLQHLKDQAKDRLKAGQATSLAKAQFQVARQYGYASWPKLKAHVESLQTTDPSCGIQTGPSAQVAPVARRCRTAPGRSNAASAGSR